MKIIAVLNEFSVEAIRDALQKLDDFDNLTVNGLNAFQLNEVEKIDPLLFDSIAKRIKDGRWMPNVGMWCEEKENISSCALIRNVMYSALYFKEKFSKKYRVFCGEKIYNSKVAQILYAGGFDAVVLKQCEKTAWVDSSDNSRILSVCIDENEIKIMDVNDIDDSIILANEFASFEEYALSIFESKLDVEILKFENVNEDYNEVENILITAETISTQNEENYAKEIRDAWISCFLGDKETAEEVAEKIINGRTLDKDYIIIDKPGVKIDAYKYSENSSSDRIIRVEETHGKEKSVSIMCNAINAGFHFEIIPYEMMTFRIDSEGFVKETLLTE